MFELPNAAVMVKTCASKGSLYDEAQLKMFEQPNAAELVKIYIYPKESFATRQNSSCLSCRMPQNW
ncbi:MAG: hypothetical protein Q4D80_04000 [Pseudomonadota bacterium]|nr:hypothetical protein [Pseudomonadota bacterium]